MDPSEFAIDKADRASGFTTGQVLAHLVMSVSVIVLAAVPLGGAARGLLRSGIARPTADRSGAATGYPQPQPQGYPQPQPQGYPQPQAYPPPQPPPHTYPPPTGRPLG